MMRGRFGSLLAKCCGYNPKVYDGSNERFGFRNRKTVCTTIKLYTIAS